MSQTLEEKMVIAKMWMLGVRIEVKNNVLEKTWNHHNSYSELDPSEHDNYYLWMILYIGYEKLGECRKLIIDELEYRIKPYE